MDIKLATGLEHFQKADRTPVDPAMARALAEFVPHIYFWLDIVNEKPVLMTAAVPWKGINFGLSFPVSKNKVQARMDSTKLLRHMREVASVLALHGKKVLDDFGEINPKLVNEQEAIRWKLDPLWDRRVKAVDKLIKIKDISKEKAKELKLL